MSNAVMVVLTEHEPIIKMPNEMGYFFEISINCEFEIVFRFVSFI